jgi:hypothetical protein
VFVGGGEGRKTNQQNGAFAREAWKKERGSVQVAISFFFFLPITVAACSFSFG